MSIVSEIPITKTHSIKWCSWGTLCLLLLALITLLIPFFLVFIQGFFKNTIQKYQFVKLSSTNQYYIFASTPTQSMTATNLISSTDWNPNIFIDNLKISQQDYNNDGVNDNFMMEATIKQPTSNAASNIQNIMILLFFNAESQYFNTTALALFNYHGSSISSVFSAAQFKLMQNSVINQSSSNINSTLNQFIQKYYNIPLALESYYQQPVFFSKVSNDMITNENSAETNIKIDFNLQKQQRLIVRPGVFQQIQWSWCYYFPVALVLGYFCLWLLDLFLKYGIIESRVRRF